MTTTEIIAALGTLSLADVREVNQAAYKILKSERSNKVHAAKLKLARGMKVSFLDKQGYRLTGTIKKVNRTRCVVDTGGYRTWTVPMTMLSAA
jgi:hypothetical protein